MIVLSGKPNALVSKVEIELEQQEMDAFYSSNKIENKTKETDYSEFNIDNDDEALRIINDPASSRGERDYAAQALLIKMNEKRDADLMIKYAEDNKIDKDEVQKKADRSTRLSTYEKELVSMILNLSNLMIHILTEDLSGTSPKIVDFFRYQCEEDATYHEIMKVGYFFHRLNNNT